MQDTIIELSRVVDFTVDIEVLVNHYSCGCFQCLHRFYYDNLSIVLELRELNENYFCLEGLEVISFMRLIWLMLGL